MMDQIFLTILEISLTTGIVILSLTLLSSQLNQHYSFKWKYWLWIILAIRLIIPINLTPNFQQLTLPIPDITIMSLTNNVNTENIALSLDLGSDLKQPELTLLHIITLIWILGCILFLLTHATIYLKFKRNILHQGQKIESKHILQELKNISTHLNLHKKILPLSYSNINSPMILGFVHPILILPEVPYDNEELSFILKHELIHVKRRDNYYKLLLIICNSLHWFNPVIYRMMKEATNDLELSCDQEVIKDSSLSQRKAYTEAIFTTIEKKGTKIMLSTQFYGGTKIMKKRFSNILGEQNKKNGFLMMLLVVLLTLSLGLLVACSKQNQTTEDSNVPETISNTTLQPTMQDIPDVKNIAKTPEPTNVEPNNTDLITTENLSTDAAEIKGIVEEFSLAYFKGDIDTLTTFLTDSYEWDVDVYSETDKSADITDTTLKGLSNIATKKVNDISDVSLEFRPSTKDDSFKYLTIELIKETEGWKIYFYGIEG